MQQHFDETAAAIACGCVKVTTNSRHTQVKRLYGHHVERRHLPKEFAVKYNADSVLFIFFTFHEMSSNAECQNAMDAFRHRKEIQ